MSASRVFMIVVALLSVYPASSFFVGSHEGVAYGRRPQMGSVRLKMSEEAARAETFREAEIVGLELLKTGMYQDALNAFELGMKLPGSKMDILRKPMIGGPSPVGGAASGREGSVVYGLDEFERQAGYYNLACCYAKLGKPSESVASLRSAFRSGFDDWKTVRTDPDMESVRGTPEYEALLQEVDPKFNFPNSFPNPFTLFGKQ